jgi:hypothetical protein
MSQIQQLALVNQTQITVLAPVTFPAVAFSETNYTVISAYWTGNPTVINAICQFNVYGIDASGNNVLLTPYPVEVDPALGLAINLKFTASAYTSLFVVVKHFNGGGQVVISAERANQSTTVDYQYPRAMSVASSMPANAAFGATARVARAAQTIPNSFPTQFTALSDGFRWVPQQAIANISPNTSVTGTTSATQLAGVLIPANTLGASGTLRVTALFNVIGTAGAKTVNVNFGGPGNAGAGGVNFVNLALTATNLSAALQRTIHNTATNAQIYADPSQTMDGYQSTVALATGAIDTTVDQLLAVNVTLANAADKVTLSHFLVEVL